MPDFMHGSLANDRIDSPLESFSDLLKNLNPLIASFFPPFNICFSFADVFYAQGLERELGVDDGHIAQWVNRVFNVDDFFAAETAQHLHHGAGVTNSELRTGCRDPLRLLHLNQAGNIIKFYDRRNRF